MPARSLTWLLTATLLAGCGGGDDTAGTPPDSLLRQVFAGVPLIPDGVVGNVTGEGTAAQAMVRVPRPPESVATWYRRELLARRWTIVSDARTGDGAVTLHATDPDRRPIWLIIGPDPPGAGTLVTVVGAVPGAGDDTTRR
jgi:hypothetical protein